MTGFKLMVPLSTSGKATSQKFQTEALPVRPTLWWPLSARCLPPSSVALALLSSRCWRCRRGDDAMLAT
jgi:hypothetical protein